MGKMTVVIVTKFDITETLLKEFVEELRKVKGVSEATVLRHPKGGYLI